MSKINKIFPLLLSLLILGASCRSLDSNTTKNKVLGNPSEDFLEKVQDSGLYFGAAVNPDLLGIEGYKSALEKNFNFITAENVMKWEIIHPTKDTYDFTQSDKLMDFAETNGMEVRGHTLAWHYQNPAWLTEGNFSKEELLTILEDHIKTIVGRYKGRIIVWDVVNEGIDGSKFRDTIWYKGIGPEYIELAFKWAHEADPDAKLIYNDYAIGQINQKSTSVYEMVKELKEKGVPITGVGFQIHEDLHNSYDFSSLYNNVKRFDELGMHVDFTEIDIRMKGEATDVLLRKQAKYYQKLMEVMLAFDNSNFFTIWGISDAHSWIPGYFIGFDHALIFDKDFNPKPAYYAIYETITAGPKELKYAPAGSAKTRTVMPPFQSIEAETVPTIDGDPNDAVWATGITYPFGFNQLNEMNLSIQDTYKDSFGEWIILYKGNKVYGRVIMVDDKTVTSAGNVWENDNIEIFLDLNKTWTQLRTVAGEDFGANGFEGKRKAVWSKDNTVLEFEIEMPIDDLVGQMAGWNMALSDNDGGEVRDAQYYALNGINKGWEGKGFGNLQFVGNSPKPPEEPRIVKPLIAYTIASDLTIDGKLNEAEWAEAVEYSLVYNQINPTNKLPNRDYKDFSTSVGLIYTADTMYGFVKRQDDITVSDKENVKDNDYVEMAFKLGDKKFSLESVVGGDFIPKEGIDATGVWSSDGSVFEFKIILTEDELKPYFIGFNIAVADVDDSGLEYKLFPFTGDDKISELSELGEIHLMK